MEKTGIEVWAVDKFSHVFETFEKYLGASEKATDDCAKQWDHFFKEIEKSSAESSKAVSKASKEQGSSLGAIGKSFGSAALQALGFGTGMMTVQGAVNLVKGAIDTTIGAATRMESAMNGVTVSAESASREFGKSVGTTDFWTSAVQRLSDELRVFTDVSVAQAVSRTIDMTKRLGMTSDQMEEIVRRSGDLAAKVGIDLPSAVERVTSAMRGEAESAEYLGLTLSETYMATHALELGFDKAWKSMTETEKAQVRYAAFLQQTEGVIGTAAASTDTLAGAQAELARQTERLGAAIGEELIPLKLKLIATLADTVEALNEEGVVMTRVTAGYAVSAQAAAAMRREWDESGKALVKLTDAQIDMAEAASVSNEQMRLLAYGTEEYRRSILATTPEIVADTDALRDYGAELERTKRVSEHILETKHARLAADEAEKASTKAAEEALKSYEKAVEGAESQMRSMIETLLTPTPVTQLDMWKTQLGEYEDKWDEAARRMRTVMEDPSSSPWTTLMIPEDVRAQGVTAVKAYAAEWLDGFYTGLRPEAINWDAFIQALRDQMAAAAAKENMLAEAMRRAAEDPELAGISRDMVEGTMAAMLGIAPPPVFGEMGAQMQGLTGLQIPELDAALDNLALTTVPGLGLAVATFYADAETQFGTLTAVTVPSFETALAAMTEVAREKFGLIQTWLDGIEATLDEIVKSMEKLSKEIEDLPSSKTITIKIKYEVEGSPPAGLQYGGVIAPNLPRGTPVPVVAHAGEAFLGWPYNPAWASRAVPGPSAVAGSALVHRTTNVSHSWQFGPNTVAGGMDLAALQATVRRTIIDAIR